MLGEKLQSGDSYRPDLDGLRAVAVLPVILFHLGFPYTPGGFVGVDVFFVLSGYLITRQIATDLHEGRFSLLRFYDRRIRRLFPALFAMLLGSTILALILFLPQELEGYGESLIAALLSVGNIYFWHESDYFAPAAETMPLLHTWSLAIEEQYYLLFPLLFLLAWRSAPRLIWRLVAATTLLSFFVCLWMTFSAPAAAFYLLPMRAWELLVGSLLALRSDFAPKSQFLSSAAASTGVSAIAVAVLTFDNNTAFPGFAAIVPTLGGALVIWAGQKSPAPDRTFQKTSVVLMMLAWRPLVFVGLISYSLYLWHWPLIVFARQWSFAPLSVGASVLIVAITFCIATLSWKYIETPLRRGHTLWRTVKERWAYMIALTACLVGVGIGIDRGKGFPALQSDEVRAVLASTDDRSPAGRRCNMRSERYANTSVSDACTFGLTDRPRVIVLGDSHGPELAHALSRAAESGKFHLLTLATPGCAPVVDFSSSRRPTCAPFMKRMMKGLGKISPSTVVVAGYHFSRSRPGNTSSEAYWSRLEHTVEKLRKFGHDVVLLGGWPPHLDGHLPQLLAKRTRWGHPIGDYEFLIDQEVARVVETKLKLIASRQKAFFIPLLEAVCGNTQLCRGVVGGQPIYYDKNHITQATADRVVASTILPRLLDLLAASPSGETSALK